MSRILRSLFVLGVFALLGIAHMAKAESYFFFPNDVTINYVVSSNNDAFAIVGYASGSLGYGFQTPSSPTVNIVSGGSIDMPLLVYNGSKVNILGGHVDVLQAHDRSIINLITGSIGGYMTAYDHSTINIKGGNIPGDGSLHALNSGRINIYGTNLTATLIDPKAGDGFYSQYAISGTLYDGTVYSGQRLFIQNGSGASFHLYSKLRAYADLS